LKITDSFCPFKWIKWEKIGLKLLPKSKKAGYLSGYADPEYIEQLQQISYHFWANTVVSL
jgi:hypothetical protein